MRQRIGEPGRGAGEGFMTYMVRTVGGRLLAVETWGAPHGKPVFLLHGSPGSRLGPRPRSALLYRLGIKLIAYDRPGYGDSPRLPGRRVEHAAADVAAIADDLGLDRFAVLGRSGGAPHALACAALLPERVAAAAALVGPAPRDAEGLDWYAGMNEANVTSFRAAEQRLGELIRLLESKAAAVRADPARALPFQTSDLPVSDVRILANLGVMRMLMSNFTEAVKHSTAGWLDDVLAFISPWGFDPRSITVPLHLWHGDLDAFVPVSHTLWLAERIKGATVTIARGSAHFGAMEAMPDILRRLVADR